MIIEEEADWQLACDSSHAESHNDFMSPKKNIICVSYEFIA